MPIAHISWRSGGTRRSRVLNGPDDHFKTQQEAEAHAVAIGRKWIDDGGPGIE